MRNMWRSASLYHGKERSRKFRTNVVLLTYYIEVHYQIVNLYDWAMLEQSPGRICDMVLRSIKLRAQPGKGKSQVNTSRKGKVVLAGGFPIPQDHKYDSLRKMIPKYYPSQQRRWGLILEREGLGAGSSQPELDQMIDPELPEETLPGPGLRRRNAVRVDPVGPRYRPPAERVNYPKDGDLCPKCGAVMRPCLAQSRTDKYDPIGNPYWDLYGLSQTGLYEPEFLKEVYPSEWTEHRARLAQRRWEECHPVRCTVDVQHSKVNYATC